MFSKLNKLWTFHRYTGIITTATKSVTSPESNNVTSITATAVITSIHT